MIIITFKAKDRAPATPPKSWKGRIVVSPTPPESVPTLIRNHMNRLKEGTGLLFVEPGGKIHDRLDLLLNGNGFDVAAHVHRPSSAAPTAPGRFDGIGHISPRTVFFRSSAAGRRVLDRWIERDKVSPKVGAENLIYALRDIEDANFLHLPPAYCWIEHEMRPFFPEVQPVVEYDAPVISLSKLKEGIRSVSLKPTPKSSSIKCHGPEVLQSGHFLSWASYGRLNREILFRIANSLTVQVETKVAEPVLVDQYTYDRVEVYKRTVISSRAPVLRLFGPDYEPDPDRFSINFTLMETERVHRDMVFKINARFNELWTCTDWGKTAFVDSGVTVPIRVVPLGVNPAIYRPLRRGRLPPCRLTNTSRRGLIGVPSGFVVLAVGLPSRRKNFELIAEAMELAFQRRSDVDFVIATTHAPSGWSTEIQKKFSKLQTRIWMLEGRFTDHEMANIYAASDLVASASLGEGWGLPAHEAAACRKPIVVPRNSAHPDVFGPDALSFDHDRMAVCRETESVSPWYQDALWPVYGSRARRALAELLRAVYAGDRTVRERTDRLYERMRRLTWDATAERVATRLIEVQP